MSYRPDREGYFERRSDGNDDDFAIGIGEGRFEGQLPVTLLKKRSLDDGPGLRMGSRGSAGLPVVGPDATRGMLFPDMMEGANNEWNDMAEYERQNFGHPRIGKTDGFRPFKYRDLGPFA